MFCNSFSRIIVTNFLPTRMVSVCKYASKPVQSTFVGEKDIYNGVTVDSTKEGCNEHNLREKLDDSLEKWMTSGQRCIWFKINVRDSFYVPILAEKGFNFHHAREDFVMMYKWLAKGVEPNLPPTCHTNLGVGAMVFNDKSQILAISEKHYQYPHWKLPGGYVERGEGIVNAAVREVKEETGVDSTFQSLVTFRHSHNMMFGNSDIYVILMMKALSVDITCSQKEVKDCKWMEVEEYLNHPHVHEFNRIVVQKALYYKGRRLKIDLQKKRVKWAKFEREMDFLLVEDY